MRYIKKAGGSVGDGDPRGGLPDPRLQIPGMPPTSKGLGSQAESTCCKSEGVGITVQPRCGEPDVPGKLCTILSGRARDTPEKVSHKSREYVRKNRLEGKRMNGLHELSLG